MRATVRAGAGLDPPGWTLVLRSVVALSMLLVLGWALGAGLGRMLAEAVGLLLTGVGTG